MKRNFFMLFKKRSHRTVVTESNDVNVVNEPVVTVFNSRTKFVKTYSTNPTTFPTFHRIQRTTFFIFVGTVFYGSTEPNSSSLFFLLLFHNFSLVKNDDSSVSYPATVA